MSGWNSWRGRVQLPNPPDDGRSHDVTYRNGRLWIDGVEQPFNPWPNSPLIGIRIDGGRVWFRLRQINLWLKFMAILLWHGSTFSVTVKRRYAAPDTTTGTTDE